MSLLCLAVLTALLVDRWLGEPPSSWHPVVWMGHFLGWFTPRVAPPASEPPEATDWAAFWRGLLAWWLGAALVLLAAFAVQGLLGRLPEIVAALLLGLALKPLLAWAMLRREVLAVEAALDPAQGGSLQRGRERLSWLVSRDVSQLSEAQVRESAIESLAENLNDSVVAPLFWFVVAGLPGAALYRFANTADAMWGYRGNYRGRQWEWAGKWAARVDDALSWLPARLTALLLALASGMGSLRRLRQDARRTPSPNSGWPMAAMALALGVSLGKPGVYTLNPGAAAPGAAETVRAAGYGQNVVSIVVGVVSLILLFGWKGVNL